MEKARNLWPEKIKELPMNDTHKVKLQAHWASLQNDFRICVKHRLIWH
jgi:serine/threonine-protein kinase HipA